MSEEIANLNFSKTELWPEWGELCLPPYFAWSVEINLMGNITVFSAATAVLAFSRGALENAFPTHAFVRAAIPHVVFAIHIQPYRHIHFIQSSVKSK